MPQASLFEKPTSELYQSYAEVIYKKRTDGYTFLGLGCSMLGFQPGQYLTIDCEEETIAARPFSIVNANSTITEILFSVKGDGTRWLSERREWNTVYVQGPMGNSFELKPDTEDILFIAGGIGIAPILSLIIGTDNNLFLRRHLLYGAKDKHSLIPIYNRHNLSVDITTEDGSRGDKGRVTKFLRDDIHRYNPDQIFACGPMGMLQAVQEILKSYNTPCQVALETIMGCGGQGNCCGCAIPVIGKNGEREYSLLCQHGQIRDIREVDFNVAW